ncbi:helix-turn-helix transcriptional regulator [Elizabethkingia anophelis]|uniref:helix-turn-helix domain-containing protein n=1 Tax=Elizabethkingia anophelis TaxID=1117645 RepID=UPI000C99AC5F|nr:helix-turn-helix transcriptional regulator [Elizabethkingia anophelis]MCT3760543.1 helix-turn-helix transcriptional regulator [Elizabethkingia anophelis]MCT3975191.1 helix-turn-helix transcriptional regulator [Elizabethkingia anophelis]MCT4003700.1 helix-turn-helix transcriptional regulator [Elizabethkingia anophelis]MCT4017792.1 helix-turn-helix transcriptional regulator [Elizabethkingia anophelis]MCT4021364.1 helix-turn-helix transcriptional regulator [Elizabethkingia anophelis]
MDLINKSTLFIALLKFILFNSQMIGVSESGIENKFGYIEFRNFQIDKRMVYNNYSTIKKNEVVANFKNEEINVGVEMNTLKKVLYICLGAFLFIGIQSGYYAIVRKGIKRENISSINKLDVDCVKNSLSSDLEKTLLKKIHFFESSEKFLKKNITLSYLSHLFNTNPKYLSKFIKLHRERSFNSYINYLRINYIIQKLCEKPVYREYKISYLAEECGYASPQVFICAFRKETGMTPILFITNLKNQMVISHS